MTSLQCCRPWWHQRLSFLLCYQRRQIPCVCYPIFCGDFVLTHWGRVTHICLSKVTIIVSDNGLSPGRRQAIIWNNAGILLIGPLGTNFIGILIEIHTFSFKKMHLKMSSGKWRPFCLGLNVLTKYHIAHEGGQEVGNPLVSFYWWVCLLTQITPHDAARAPSLPHPTWHTVAFENRSDTLYQKKGLFLS